MWWIWARVVAAGALSTSAPHRDAAVAPSTAARVEHVPTHTSADPPPPPPGPAVELADDDVVRALELRQPSFLRCFRIAQRDDLMLATARVSLHVKVGVAGTVDAATADGGTVALDTCVEMVSRHLTFAPPIQPVEASLTLFFQ